MTKIEVILIQIDERCRNRVKGREKKPYVPKDPKGPKKLKEKEDKRLIENDPIFHMDRLFRILLYQKRASQKLPLFEDVV